MKLYAVVDRNDDERSCVLAVAPNRSRAITLAWKLWPGWYEGLLRSDLRASVCPGADVPEDAEEKAYDSELDAPPWVSEWWCSSVNEDWVYDEDYTGRDCNCRWCQRKWREGG
jgi:hypothetical protein